MYKTLIKPAVAFKGHETWTMVEEDLQAESKIIQEGLSVPKLGFVTSEDRKECFFSEIGL